MVKLSNKNLVISVPYEKIQIGETFILLKDFSQKEGKITSEKIFINTQVRSTLYGISLTGGVKIISKEEMVIPVDLNVGWSVH